MDTEKLYDQDAFLREFDAVVTECYEGKDGSCLVPLDRTAFYPEGGGQPADHGVLGGAAVLDVQEREGRVLHTCDRPLPVGRTVRGVIDWDRRFDHMQQHSGEHIVSGMLCAAFSCDNVGFHMGADTVIIDYNAPMTWEQVLEVEDRANRYIWENHLFRAYYPTPEELAVLSYRSKKAIEGPVRITEFPGADRCACCGTHVAASGQVGLVKFLSCQKLRDGVRLELLCGGRAMEYLSRCWDQSRRIGQALSVKPQAAFPAVQRLEEQLRNAGVVQGNIFGMTATEAAYAHGDAWLDGLLDYLREAEKLLRRELSARLPEAVLSPMNATYLGWLDLRAYGFTTEELMKRTHQAGVAFTPGTFFGGEAGEGFLRFNFACPHSQTLEAVRRLEAALKH